MGAARGSNMPIPIAGIAMIVFEAEALFNDVLKLMGKDTYLKKEESLEEQVAEGGV